MNQNPYSATTERTFARKGSSFLFWFVMTAILMVGFNLFPLLATWRAFHSDGMEQIGFPVTFFKRGGFSYHHNFFWGGLCADAVVLLLCSSAAGYCLRNGWRDALIRLNTANETGDD